MNWALRRVLAALVGLVALVALPAWAQPSDPFVGLQKDLARAAEFHLGEVQQRSRRTAAEVALPKQSALATTRPLFPHVLAGALSEQVGAARERLLALGVDASRIFAEEGIPVELLLVAAVESNYDPLARSPKGARGLWQLMPGTAARLGLRVGQRIDERTHPVRSTRAAAKYLREVYGQFEDWLLVLAAYNAGEARVHDAIRRASVRDFWLLSAKGLLPDETRRYVPAVLWGAAPK